MNIKYFFKVALFTLSILLISCSVTEEAPVVIEETKSEVAEAVKSEVSEEKLNVLATTPMIGAYVKEVGGDNINLYLSHFSPSTTFFHSNGTSSFLYLVGLIPCGT